MTITAGTKSLHLPLGEFMKKGWDIYGKPLKLGHCRRHPEIKEPFPCSKCAKEMMKKIKEKSKKNDKNDLDVQNHEFRLPENQK